MDHILAVKEREKPTATTALVHMCERYIIPMQEAIHILTPSIGKLQDNPSVQKLFEKNSKIRMCDDSASRGSEAESDNCAESDEDSRKASTKPRASELIADLDPSKGLQPINRWFGKRGSTRAERTPLPTPRKSTDAPLRSDMSEAERKSVERVQAECAKQFPASSSTDKDQAKVSNSSVQSDLKYLQSRSNSSEQKDSDVVSFEEPTPRSERPASDESKKSDASWQKIDEKYQEAKEQAATAKAEHFRIHKKEEMEDGPASKEERKKQTGLTMHAVQVRIVLLSFRRKRWISGKCKNQFQMAETFIHQRVPQRRRIRDHLRDRLLVKRRKQESSRLTG